MTRPLTTRSALRMAPLDTGQGPLGSAHASHRPSRQSDLASLDFHLRVVRRTAATQGRQGKLTRKSCWQFLLAHCVGS
eukprot:5922971-Amphidinium_carterae.1